MIKEPSFQVKITDKTKLNEFFEVKKAIYLLKKYIKLEGLICDRTILDKMINVETKEQLRESSNLVIFGVDCKSNSFYTLTERYSDE